MELALPIHIIYEIFVPMWLAKVLAAALFDSRSRGYKRLLVDITSPSDKPLMLGFSPIRASGGQWLFATGQSFPEKLRRSSVW